MNELILFTGRLQGAVDPNLTLDYMLLGYVVMWLIALLYVASLASRQHNLQKEIKLLQQLLEEDENVREL
jgi:CcmD family protein